jgi:hypothetical protein
LERGGGAHGLLYIDKRKSDLVGMKVRDFISRDLESQGMEGGTTTKITTTTTTVT